MKNIYKLMLLVASPISFADTNEPLSPCQIQSYCMEATHEHTSKDNLIKINSEKLDKNESTITQLDKNFAVFEQKYSNLNEKIERLDNTVWGNFSNITEIFMWVFALGMGLTGLFIWRDHSVFRKRLEIEEQEIKYKKQEIDLERKNLKDLLHNTTREVNFTLENLKKKLIIDSALISKNYNEDELYVAIKHLSLSMDLDIYALFNKLSNLNVLSESVQQELDNMIREFKTDIGH